MDDRKLATLMTGKAFAYRTPAADSAKSQTRCCRVRHLSRTGQYEDVSLDIRAGEIRRHDRPARFGPHRVRAVPVRHEPAEFRGNPSSMASRWRSRPTPRPIEEGIAYVSEDRLNLGLVLEQPIASNILRDGARQAARPTGPGAGGDAASARRGNGSRTLAIKAPNPDHAVRTLSGGNQQRVVLAKWMATQPRLLILDSPTVGVDIAAKDGIYEVVRALAAKGVAILLISDEYPKSSITRIASW